MPPTISFDELPELIPPDLYEAYILTAKGFAAKQRLGGGGPPYIKFGGRVRYPKKELKKWIEEGLQTSTSEGK